MSSIEIVKEMREQDVICFQLKSGKAEAVIYHNARLGYVNVCCLNAAHRAWRGSGRYFSNFAKAVDGYKSAAVKSMVKFVEGEAAAMGVQQSGGYI